MCTLQRHPFAIAREFYLKTVPRTVLCGFAAPVAPLRYRSGVLPQNHPPDGFVRLCRTGKTGGAYRDRTDDPLLAKQVLSQLS